MHLKTIFAVCLVFIFYEVHTTSTAYDKDISVMYKSHIYPAHACASRGYVIGSGVHIYQRVR